ncbi:Ribonuclease HI, partial [Haemophilus influenzae]
MFNLSLSIKILAILHNNLFV